MSWLDFFKFKNSQEVHTEGVSEELSQQAKAVYVSFDKASLRVSGGSKEAVSNGVFDWREEVFLDKYNGTKNANTAVLATMAMNDLKHRLEGGQDISVSLPLESVFSKYITIPKNDLPEKLLQAEIKKYVPIPFSETLFASNKVSETESSASYFCIVVQKTLFDTYVTMFKNYGIQPYFELGCFSLSRLSGEGINVLVWFGAGESYILLVKNGILIECSELNITYKNLIEGIMTGYSVSYEDASILLDSYFNKKISAESVAAIEAIINPLLVNLAREIITTNNIFSTSHKLIIEKNILIGIDFVLINNFINSVTDTHLHLERLANIDVQNDRYTHHIGLAKRN